jgi:hypothetical protein
MLHTLHKCMYQQRTNTSNRRPLSIYSPTNELQPFLPARVQPLPGILFPTRTAPQHPDVVDSHTASYIDHSACNRPLNDATHTVRVPSAAAATLETAHSKVYIPALCSRSIPFGSESADGAPTRARRPGGCGAGEYRGPEPTSG